jgi:hypothetical protein
VSEAGFWEGAPPPFRNSDIENSSGGLGRPMTQEDCHRILKAAGWTTSNIRHAMDLAELSRVGGEQAFEDFLQEFPARIEQADARG